MAQAGPEERSRARQGPAKSIGWIGIAIVTVGAAVAALGVWYMMHARPKVGAVIDEIAIDGGKLVVRAEDGGPRSFVELHLGGELKWQAMIPHYAGARGRRAIAWSPDAVTVRVERNGRAEVFAFAMRDAAKIGGFRLAPEHEPIQTQREGPITLTDQVRSYEFVGGADWNQLIAIDLRSGLGVWKVDLGKGAIRDAGVNDASLWIDQMGRKRTFDPATGRETN